MFTFLSRFRRQTAVLTALALVASVLVAVPVSAADDDPKADYTATFSACVGAATEDQEFTDVPELHANWGDINCIGYYGITMGTGDGTTYSPIMSVTRKQMALFLTRLAKVVGIEMVADPTDPGFTDIGDLDEDAQTAIAQLKELNITKGNNPSGTTYGPEGHVTRGQMALFIARLMKHMDPMAEDSDTVFGYKPEDVGVVNVIDTTDDDDDPDEPGKARSPFTDLDRVTKETYDAITNLWELGVIVKGISDTGYAPAASIRRDHMAAFMTGVMDHSNARPAGVSIQAAKTWDFDLFSTKIAVSYRDDKFAPMVDVSIKTFHSDADSDETAGVGEFTEGGGCETATECAWTDDESLTDGSGNVYIDGSVPDGKMNTYYAWMGDLDAEENDFNVNESAHASVTLSSTTDATGLKVTSDISANSTTENTVDIDGKGSVTFTVQLVDSDDGAVAKSGEKITVEWKQTPDGGDQITVYPAPAALETDDDGQATFTISGPKSTKGNTDTARVDVVTFSADVNEDETTGDATSGETSENTVNWSDADAVLTSGKGSAPAYVIRDSKNKASVRASVSFYDQYGNTAGKGFLVNIKIGEADAQTRTVSSRGVASWSETLEIDENALSTNIAIVYDAVKGLPDPANDNNRPGLTPTISEGTSVEVVKHADDDSTAAAAAITVVYADDNRFLIGNDLYTYYSDDKFVYEGELVDMAKFESLIKKTENGDAAMIQVVSYDDDGSSIFRVQTKAS